MVWIFVLMDVIILAALVFLCVVAVRLWNRHRPLTRGALSEFRNDDLYEKSEQDKKRLAHIEDSFEEVDASEIDCYDGNDLPISDRDISFTAGYGRADEMEGKMKIDFSMSGLNILLLIGIVLLLQAVCLLIMQNPVKRIKKFVVRDYIILAIILCIGAVGIVCTVIGMVQAFGMLG